MSTPTPEKPATDAAPPRPYADPHGVSHLDPPEARRNLSALMNNLPGMAYYCRNDRQRTLEFASAGCRELTGYDPADLAGNPALAYAELIHPEDREAVWEGVQAAVGERRAFRLIYRVVAAGGEEKWVWEQGHAVFGPDGAPRGLEGFITDITERKRAEQDLRESEERYRGLFENANDIFYTHDLAGNFTSLNKAGERVTGYTREEALRLNIADVVAPDHLQRARAMIGRKAREHEATVYELDIVAKDGRTVPLEVSTRLVCRDGRPVGVQGIARDVTERRLAEERLRRYAFSDSLTDLPNRSLFTNHLELAVERAKRDPHYLFAVLFLDLDRFKNVNDGLGHTVGDQLLVAFARRLKLTLRAIDTVARLGGDEFAILLDGIEHAGDAVRAAERVLQELAQPFSLDGHEVFTTASIGIALSDTGYDSAGAVLRDADTVMYRAKAQGKARYEVFDLVMHARVVELLKLENDLRRAFERQELQVQYQPIVSLATGQITGFEALARWQHPERGFIPPGEFIPVAEETGLIVPLGWWVLREACTRMSRWQKIAGGGGQPLRLSVNLSGRQFVQPDLFERVVGLLEETNFDPFNLQLEITESVLMESAQATVTTLSRLRDIGVQLAIDDFGTGYSSLSYLRRFPIHTLKIDRSFVSKEGGDARENAEIVRTIVMLARNMRKEVVAEGVETQEQMKQLRLLGCDYGQGYYFSRPVNTAAVAALIARGLEAAPYVVELDDTQAA